MFVLIDTLDVGKVVELSAKDLIAAEQEAFQMVEDEKKRGCGTIHEFAETLYPSQWFKVVELEKSA